MTEFYESSAFTKLFVSEPDSMALLHRYRSHRERAVSRLAGLEARSAIRRLETFGALTTDQAMKARASLDMELGKIPVVTLEESVMLQAQQLIERSGIRSLDAIQLASALSLRQDGSVLFVSADERLNEAAKAEGLTILNPREL